MAGKTATNPKKRAEPSTSSKVSKQKNTNGKASKSASAGAKKAKPSGDEQHTIGGYLIDRLQAYGVDDVFGIPGDFVLNFYGMLEESPIRVVGTTREDNAGYAADAYARVHGLGAVCVTYCVGGLSLCNSIAGAFAEKSPVVVISGAPGVDERTSDPLLHHRVRDFDTQRQVFEKITVANASLDDPLTAFREIDRCLEAAVRYKRPVFLELPRDRVETKALYPHVPLSRTHPSDAAALSEALDEAAEMIAGASQPVILAGVETHRFGLREPVLEFAERNSIPVCSTLLGKSVVSEKHPLYLGVYEGAMGRASVREYVEGSDCVILLGCFMTDINLGIYTARLDPGRCVYATSEKLRISHHHFHDVELSDFVSGLAEADLKMKKRKLPKNEGSPLDSYEISPDANVTVRQLFGRINAMLDEKMVVVADVGDSLFGSVDLSIHQHTEFLSPAYYTSMGFAVPASVGVQVADRSLRPLVLVGDGAFQMTGQELSTSLKLGFNPIVVVLNNHGYTTERFLQEGPFNDIPDWAYHRMPDLLGGGWGFEIRTEGELDQALKAAMANEDAFSILNVHLKPDDVSPALTRLAERMSKQV
ncbi:alpha-keto acid decarboxylase family protein [Stratiformator vulcanicus]|uniref:Indole-3-pyruvate decarboxylase n=1 Tax=Stratiformator vulcanicus TaxID=2527980 RepID=A0A517R096_9PLAN|nr:thiamine pyrophosphate-binding protein [Stratiformator vulcanicus]QDT37288.1 Indole-3-pyruvate decarboxylase [Stratiformator vulcanicus]